MYLIAQGEAAAGARAPGAGAVCDDDAGRCGHHARHAAAVRCPINRFPWPPDALNAIFAVRHRVRQLGHCTGLGAPLTQNPPQSLPLRRQGRSWAGSSDKPETQISNLNELDNLCVTQESTTNYRMEGHVAAPSPLPRRATLCHAGPGRAMPHLARPSLTAPDHAPRNE